MNTTRRIAVGALIALSLTACGTKEIRYVTATEPAPAPTEAPTTTRPRPTTTQPYKSDIDWFLEGINLVMDGRVYVDDYSLVETGTLVCTALDSGATATDVMLALYESAPVAGNSQDLLIATSVAATTFLCPEWSWIWD